MIAPSILRDLIGYDPDTGAMVWKPRPETMFVGKKYSAARLCAMWNSNNAGKPALAAESDGYLVGAIFGRLMKAHRVAWAIHYGQWPKQQIDHINGDRADNRISNLRDVSHAENGRNAKGQASQSGVCGVHPTPHGTWSAAIKVSGRKRHLGTFKSKEAAAEARRVAEAQSGFHPNHGRSATL